MRWPGGERVVNAVWLIGYRAENDGEHAARSCRSNQEQPILVGLSIDDVIGTTRLLNFVLRHTMASDVRNIPIVPDKVAKV